MSRMIRLFRSRRLSQQILLLVAVFTLPMALAALYFVVTGINKDIDFATHEQHGDAYLQPLDALLESVPRHERVALRLLSGDRAARTELTTLEARIDQAWNQLAAVHQQYGAELQFTPEGLSKRKREHILLSTVWPEWTSLKTSFRTLSPETIAQRHRELVADIRNMITHAGDTSFLILDPDLDSYYLMDATLVSLPQTQNRLADLIAYAEDVAHSSSPGTALDPSQRIQFAVYRALIQESDANQILNDIRTSLNEDAGFYGVSPSLQHNLPPAVEQYSSANQALLSVLERLSQSGQRTDLPALGAAAQKARDASFRLWDVAVPELDHLLDLRIHDRLRARSLGLAATGAALCLSALLAFFIIADITRSLRKIMATLRSRTAALSLDLGDAVSGGLSSRRGSQDELLILSDTFDAMLAGIERRDLELARHRQSLESQVTQRTGELTEANRALQLARKKAEESTRLKGEFLANMSHEIRTPMNGVVGMTELALETDLTREQRDYLSIVKSSAADLLAIINDILDFSRIEAGKLPLHSTDFDPRKLVSDTAKSLALRAHQKGIELLWWVAPDVPPVLFGDPVRIRQVIVNLIGNALKFTDHGEVVLRVEREGFHNGQLRLCFTVRDTGIGIPHDKQDGIFKAFEQVDGSAARSHGGTGLGLAIVSQLASLMHGSVSVQSEPGVGSCFIFRACFESGSATNPKPAELLPHQGTRALVIDDNETARGMLVELLTWWGLDPLAVPDAQQGLAAAQAATEQGKPFPIVLLDAGCAAVTGDNPFPVAPIRMLTSLEQQSYTRSSSKSAVEPYLLKPVNPSELLELLLSRLQGPSASASATVAESPAVAAQPSVTLHVLVAEDNPVNQKLILKLLEKRGHRVTLVSDGFEALASLEQQSFDIIFTDIQMPGLSGYDLSARIRAAEQASGKRTPIVALTAHAMNGDRERCLAAGMDGYLTKPIRFQELDQILAAFQSPATSLS